ncbi:MAG: type III pantothenate kinase [Bacteroidetes bacterium]|nr:type III pantothenate kinase [Bacteroidota bacterium]
MLLTLDIGNTNIKAGVFKDEALADHLIFTEITVLNSFLNEHAVSSIAISSVVPEKTKLIVKELSANYNFNPFIINNDCKFNLKIDYKTPETLGIDRICSAEGAFNLYGNSLMAGSCLLTIDFGTATTINIVKYPNIFAGGLIAPGIITMFKSLTTKTSQLPEITIENYNLIIGDDTNSSIASGVINSAVGLIEKVISYIKKLDDCSNLIIYVTGGMADKLQKFLSNKIIYDEFLVLRGIRSLYELNKD